MADALFDFLKDDIPSSYISTDEDKKEVQDYLVRLTSLPLKTIQNVEPASIKSSQHSLDLALQSLVSRSHGQFIQSSEKLSSLPDSIKMLRESCARLKDTLPNLDESITSFSTTFQKNSPILQQRQKTQAFSRALPQVLDILELPILLKSAIGSSNPSTALDIHSHVKRLAQMYPKTAVIKSIAAECDKLLQSLNAQLLESLQQPIKLQNAIKTIGYLKRTSPDVGGGEEIWGSVFLVARLAFLKNILQALEPLKDLADAEREEWEANVLNGTTKAIKGGGGQSERYLKRWIEVFREQSFAIVSMYRSIFPSDVSSNIATTYLNPSYMPQTPTTPGGHKFDIGNPKPPPPPSPLFTFVPHLVRLLMAVLERYLSVISEKSARESLLTQVLYASGSLGRLGGDFGMALSTGFLKRVKTRAGRVDEEEGVDEESDDEDEGGEWIDAVKKHRVLAGRLEDLAAGRGLKDGSNHRSASPQ